MPAVQAEWADTGSALLTAGPPGQATYAAIKQLLQHRALAASKAQGELLELQRSEQFHIALLQVIIATVDTADRQLLLN